MASVIETPVRRHNQIFYDITSGKAYSGSEITIESHEFYVPPVVDCFDARYNRQCPINVVYQSRDLIISNKPYDLRIDGSIESSPTLQNSLENAMDSLVSSDKKRNDLHMLHQIDYVTSGVHMFGQSYKMAVEFGKMFTSKQVAKCYVALVHGHFGLERISEDSRSSRLKECQCTYCCKDSKSDGISMTQNFVDSADKLFNVGQSNGDVIVLKDVPKKSSEKVTVDPKQFSPNSRMHGLCFNDEMNYLLIENDLCDSPLDCRESVAIDSRYDDIPGDLCPPSNLRRASQTLIVPLNIGFLHGMPCTRVLAFPISGRRHQIRIHLASIGYPIIGDPSYSDARKWGAHLYYPPSYENPLDPNSSDPRIPFRTMLHSLRTEIPVQVKSTEHNFVKFKLGREKIDADNCNTLVEGVVPVFSDAKVFYTPNNGSRYASGYDNENEILKAIRLSADDPKCAAHIKERIVLDMCKINKRIRKRLEHQSRLILNRKLGTVTILPVPSMEQENIPDEKMSSDTCSELCVKSGVLVLLATDPFADLVTPNPSLRNCKAREIYFKSLPCKMCSCSLTDCNINSNCKCGCIPFGRRTLADKAHGNLSPLNLNDPSCDPKNVVFYHTVVNNGLIPATTK